MFDDNIFGEPARSSSNTVFMGDYVNRDVAPTFALGSAYYTGKNSNKLFLNITCPESKLKNPKLKLCDSGDALLYLNTVDFEKMNDFEKSESAILFNGMNNLLGEERFLHVEGKPLISTLADQAIHSNDFKVILISRNKEKKKDGKFIGKKYKFDNIDFEAFEVVNEGNELESENLFTEQVKQFQFFDDIDLGMNKTLSEMDLKPIINDKKDPSQGVKKIADTSFINNYKKIISNKEK